MDPSNNLIHLLHNSPNSRLPFNPRLQGLFQPHLNHQFSRLQEIPRWLETALQTERNETPGSQVPHRQIIQCGRRSPRLCVYNANVRRSLSRPLYLRDPPMLSPARVSPSPIPTPTYRYLGIPSLLLQKP